MINDRQILDPEKKLNNFIQNSFDLEAFKVEKSFLPYSVILTDRNGESILIFYNAITGKLNESINGGETTVIYY